MGPVAEVSCSSYTSIAITVDGRVWSWGDCDGNALGHSNFNCHSPHWVTSLRGVHVAHGSLAYTNAAVATDEGRCYMWGGNMWEGGLAENRGSNGLSANATEMVWREAQQVPRCYRLLQVALAHRHGYLIFRKI